MTDETFLSRWSRLKRRNGSAAPVLTAEEPAAPAAEPAPDPSLPVVAEPAPPETPPETPEDEEALKDLPPIESLTAESDFTPFLRAGVPEDLHRQALRKLWTSDPVFANDDGLKDYADDYTGMFNLSEPVKTLYRVGKGFLDAAEEAAEKAAAQADGASEGDNQEAQGAEEKAPDQPKGGVSGQA
ncbi:DUF3306 domain-containing protein [Azospirillum sp.]|uniref:DUF3306 domain-containing protein n=1 Tax=Azospirillum sp. TaxID=34012 RepID=UPI002D43E776|nr:DUF3306 domain-containing protein [Azospirillum sp.]HYD69985.1 DUF3306 domain-containing protein [Azospirillum sp.]